MGIEDPETGERIPSSGKHGRKKATDGENTLPKKKQEDNYRDKYGKLLKECEEKEARIKHLEHENKRLNMCLMKLKETLEDMIAEE